MKKVWKYIVGFFTFIGSILTLFLLNSKKVKKVKEIKNKIKNVERNINKTKKEADNVKKSIKDKKEDLKNLKNKKFKKKNVSLEEASDFLKSFSKKKKK
tara:strand:- start:366 stop:662 length:297 start_codon:yes stop_codon:yes gene_type:complete